jgi:hypothetical protein
MSSSLGTCPTYDASFGRDARGSRRFRIRAASGLLVRPLPTALTIINSPCLACTATPASNGWPGSTLVSRLRGRASCIAIPHTGQCMRHPSIQLRNSAPLVAEVARWRLTQRLHICIGRVVAISPAG